MPLEENHSDPYMGEEGPGVPVYEAYVIEEVSNNDDSSVNINAGSATVNAHKNKLIDKDVDEVNSYNSSRSSKHITSTDVGFVNAHGEPSNNEL